MDRRGRWQDEASLEDCWGRSIWALGTAAAHADAGWKRRAATAELERAARRRSPWPRAMAFAALGAAELLSVAPDHRVARSLLIDAADGMPGRPDRRRLAVARTAAHLRERGPARGDDRRRPPAGPRRPTRARPRPAGLAARPRDLGRAPLGHPGGGQRSGRVPPRVRSAAHRGGRARRGLCPGGDRRRATPAGPEGSPRRRRGSSATTTASNPCGTPAPVAASTVSRPRGVNRNQGAESTLAALATLQHARRLVTAAA